MTHRLAIDFGTTNSVVARWSADAPEMVSVPGLSAGTGETHLIPSLLYVRDGRTGDVVAGDAVQVGGYDRRQDNRLFRNFKRSISTASALEPRIIDGLPWTEAEAGAHFLQCLVKALPYKTNDIEQFVITVPVAAPENYLTWLQRTLNTLPPNCIRVVDESTAAALGYAVNDPGTNVLVIDFGGGTLDLSLVRLAGSGTPQRQIFPNQSSTRDERISTAQIIAKGGASLGGSDIDQWLLAEALRLTNIPAHHLGLGYTTSLAACESAKIALSTNDAAEILLQPEIGMAPPITLKRAELEALMSQRGFYAALHQLLDRVLGMAHQQGVFKEDISHVLLVGGTSLMPSVQRALDTYFRAITQGRRKIRLPAWPALHWTVENTTIHADKPFTAVVEGALQVSAGLGLDDRLTYSYGLQILDPDSGVMRYEEIFPAGSRYPSPVVTVQLAASNPQQDAVNFVVGQIDTSAVSVVEVQYENGQAVFVSKPDENAVKIVPLNAENPISVTLTPPGIPGQKRLLAAFYMDRSRQLRLTVTDLKTRKKLLTDAILLTPSSSAEKGCEETDQKTGARFEPALVAVPSRGGGYRLSLLNFATALNFLSPSQVSIDALAAALRSSDCLVRFNAARLLCQRGDRDARLIIEDVLVNGTPPQRASAVQRLHHFSWFAAESLYKRALQDADTRVREGAVFALCKMRRPEAYRLALSVLCDRNASDGVRMSAIWGMHPNPDAGAIPVLEQALTAESPHIREQALEALGTTGSVNAIPIVQQALNDPDLDVRYAAALSWVELAGESCFVEFAHLLQAVHGEERRVLLRGFFHATNYMGIDVACSPAIAEVVAALRLTLTDDLPQTRIAAASSLAWIHHPLAEQALREGFQREYDGNVKAYMLTFAVNFFSPVANELLDAACRDEDLLVRQTGEHLQSDRKNRTE